MLVFISNSKIRVALCNLKVLGRITNKHTKKQLLIRDAIRYHTDEKRFITHT